MVSGLLDLVSSSVCHRDQRKQPLGPLLWRRMKYGKAQPNIPANITMSQWQDLNHPPAVARRHRRTQGRVPRRHHSHGKNPEATGLTRAVGAGMAGPPPRTGMTQPHDGGAAPRVEEAEKAVPEALQRATSEEPQPQGLPSLPHNASARTAQPVARMLTGSQKQSDSAFPASSLLIWKNENHFSGNGQPEWPGQQKKESTISDLPDISGNGLLR